MSRAVERPEESATVADWARISHNQSRAWPYSWRCVYPVTTGLLTEDCNAFSVATSRPHAEHAHHTHFTREHTEETP